MKYAVALLLPPLALIWVGKPFQAMFNFVCCCFLVTIPISMIWAVCVVASVEADRRNKALIKATTKAAKQAAR